MKHSDPTTSYYLQAPRPGQTLFLEQKEFAPIVLTGLRGTYDKPIIVTRSKKGVISLPLTDPSGYANRIAYKRQESGFYPSVGQAADQAALVLSDCQYVLVRDLAFKDCWQTSIYIDRSQNIAILDCDFSGGTIAIGANGIETRDILIQGCSWQQTEKNVMWDSIDWEAIHGSYENAERGVDLDNDYRHFDGDFFRAWNIAGNVTIRENTIKDAFNAIHFFNSVDALPPGVRGDTLRFNSGRRSSSNVLIENNLFERIRDNCIEPEDHAWNWVVRGNSFADCYAPYSFELDRAGWFYVYNNHHWMENPPGSKAKSERKGGSGFKCGGKQDNEGDIYVFNNSWLFKNGERLFRKGTLGRLKHYNNAVKVLGGRSRLFGSDWQLSDEADASTEQIAKSEQRRFTQRWDHFQIEMNGDWVFDKNGIDAYRFAGYEFGEGTKSKDPGYTKPSGPAKLPVLRPGKHTQNAGVAWRMRLPGFNEAVRADAKAAANYELLIPKGGPVGAGVSKGLLKILEAHLTFLPDPPLNYSGYPVS